MPGRIHRSQGFDVSVNYNKEGTVGQFPLANCLSHTVALARCQRKLLTPGTALADFLNVLFTWSQLQTVQNGQKIRGKL